MSPKKAVASKTQPSDDEDVEMSIDGQRDDAEEEGEEEVDSEEIDDEEDEADEVDEFQSDEEEEPPIPRIPLLKIKLKPPVPPSSTSNATTPVPEETPKRARLRRRPPGQLMQSSDSDESEEPLPSKRPLTTRQAVLASVAGSSHVSLDDTEAGKGKSKKKILNETELALRREETARKRKHLSEKKLEDEKAETINRLLKKQSRPRTKRTGTSSTPGARRGRGGTATSTPRQRGSGAEEEVMDVNQDEYDEEGNREAASQEPPIEPEPPTFYRWISTSRPKIQEQDTPSNSEPAVALSFSVPASLLPACAPPPPLPVVHPVCTVFNCDRNMKYRMVSQFEEYKDVGACSMHHLDVLKVALLSPTPKG